MLRMDRGGGSNVFPVLQEWLRVVGSGEELRNGTRLGFQERPHNPGGGPEPKAMVGYGSPRVQRDGSWACDVLAGPRPVLPGALTCSYIGTLPAHVYLCFKRFRTEQET